MMMIGMAWTKENLGEGADEGEVGGAAKGVGKAEGGEEVGGWGRRMEARVEALKEVRHWRGVTRGAMGMVAR